MTLLDLDQLGDVLDSARSDLYRWETLPAYEVASDGGDYRRYLDGAPEPTWERKKPWLETLTAWTRGGRARRRTRVIHDPITDYQRYACEWGYALNSPAGEEIRVIDLAEDVSPTEAAGLADFWLIDRAQPVVMIYAADGTYVGAEIVAGIDAGPYLKAAEAAWRAGRDFGAWWHQHPEHHRTAHYAAWD